MQTPPTPPAPSERATPAAARAPYLPPRVQDLGPWQAVTLAYSVPGGPGGLLNPGGSANSGPF
ncbi:hypothetical protein RDMS_13730 [Deinococcus sp. RL]|uniref:hypothetical protein n=1 Tax=Deinococcus sp. RL TaxID=1489678 RepID=UPI0004D5BF3B|nr:hypothetical protein [Deinococcus sp. RL]KEF33186.1 hypothetical protein RDMS_13730 [Deinococcus sp. RL]